VSAVLIRMSPSSELRSISKVRFGSVAVVMFPPDVDGDGDSSLFRLSEADPLTHQSSTPGSWGINDSNRRVRDSIDAHDVLPRGGPACADPSFASNSAVQPAKVCIVHRLPGATRSSPRPLFRRSGGGLWPPPLPPQRLSGERDRSGEVDLRDAAG